MKKINTVIIFFLIQNCFAQTFNYNRAWATYFGDESTSINGAKVDSDGNLYIVGGVNQQDFTDSNFVATLNSFQVNYGGGGSDGFIAKISPNGTLLWSTFFGGENADIINDICIDKANNIYVFGGTASINTNISTVGAYQTNINGAADSFIAKFSSDGSNKIWATYYDSFDSPTGNDIAGGGSTLVIDDYDNLYFTVVTSNPNMATANTFQTAFNSTNSMNTNALISKFDHDGQRIWASYYGINGSNIRSLDVSTTGLYVEGTSLDCFPNYSSNTYFATFGCHQLTPGSCKDIFLTKFSLDGGRLWSTYYGNSTTEFLKGNSVKCVDNYVYVTGASGSSVGLTTSGSFLENTAGGYSSFLSKFDENGVRQWGTMCYMPVNNGTIPYSNICSDLNGNVYLGDSSNLPGNSTIGAYQENIAGGSDCYIIKFNSNGERQWGSYYGGLNDEFSLKALCFNDNFYFVGTTKSTNNISTSNSLQLNYTTNSYQNLNLNPTNIFIAKFESNLMSINKNSTNTFDLYPNPNNGCFTISFNNNSFENSSFTLYDVMGKKILSQKLNNTETIIKSNNLTNGIYLAKISNTNQIITKKIIIK